MSYFSLLSSICGSRTPLKVQCTGAPLYLWWLEPLKLWWGSASVFVVRGPLLIQNMAPLELRQILALDLEWGSWDPHKLPLGDWGLS